MPDTAPNPGTLGDHEQRITALEEMSAFFNERIDRLQITEARISELTSVLGQLAGVVAELTNATAHGFTAIANDIYE